MHRPFLLALGVLTVPALMSCSPEPDPDLALTGGNVIDVRSGSVSERQVILVRDGRIMEVVDEVDIRVPEGVRVIDLDGAFVMPGLWDMHVHLAYGDMLTRNVFFPMSLMAGVTGIREMSGDTAMVRLRDAIETGEIQGPRVVVGALLDDPRGRRDGMSFRQPRNAAEGASAVDSAAAQGFDFVKTYSFLTADTYQGIHRRAAELGMGVEGHVPIEVPLEDALALGHRTVEHLAGVEFACSAREDELRAGYVETLKGMESPNGTTRTMQFFGQTEWEPMESLDPDACRAVRATLAASARWVVPTLIRQQVVSYRYEAPILSDAEAGALAALLDPEEVWGQVDPERRLRSVYEYRLASMDDLRDSGVRILAGSDLPGGIPLHYELALMVEGGLSPLQALQSATLSAAEYLGQSAIMGAVEVGRVADLVILQSNPLDDISHTRTIVGLVLDGHYVGPDELSAMRGGVRAVLESLR